MTPVDRLLAKLPNAKRASKEWLARCPAHDDHDPSLSIAAGDDGRALVRCRAGCDTEAVVKALGLTMRDLMPDDPPRAPDRRTPERNRRSPAYPTAAAAVEVLARKYGERSAAWTYDDPRGKPVGMVLRWDRAGRKDIRPIAREADGWRIGAMPEPRPLYRLPELLGSSELVLVVEGERCCDAAVSLDYMATTSSGGSAAAAKTNWSLLGGRDVVILPDNDRAGRKYAAQVAGILTRLDPPARVRVVELPDQTEGGDIVDWVAAGGTREALKTLIEAAPALGELETANAPGPVLTCLADVEPRPVAWLWRGRIPQGRVTVIVAPPGYGKSFVTLDAAARVSTGTPWPDGSACPRGSVVLMSAEDDAADTIRPRLDAHHADVSRIHALSAVRDLVRAGSADEPRLVERVVTLADIETIEAALKRVGDCRLLIVDPIGSYLGGGVDAHRDNEVRSVLAPLAALAERYGCAVVVVAHRRKSAGGSADDSALGSRAFTGLARSVLHIFRDPKSKARRFLLPGKCNLSAPADGLAFSIGGEPARIAWERDPVTMTADEALAAEQAPAAMSRETLLAAIRRLGGSCSARDLSRAVSALRRVSDAETSLTELVVEGYGRWDTHQAAQGGRPSRVFVLNPACDETAECDETAANVGDSEGFVTGESFLDGDREGTLL